VSITTGATRASVRQSRPARAESWFSTSTPPKASHLVDDVNAYLREIPPGLTAKDSAPGGTSAARELFLLAGEEQREAERT